MPQLLQAQLNVNLNIEDEIINLGTFFAWGKSRN